MTEADAPGIVTHYLPQFLLRQFRGETLYELDKQSGMCEPRKVKKAGQEIDLYPPEIENGLFRRLDNDAARIFREKLYGHDRINITDEEKRVLSEWLLMFAVRIPLNLELCGRITEQWEANPANSLAVLDEEIDIVMATLKRDNPTRCAEVVAILGEDGFKATMYRLLKQKILAGEHQLADGRRLFHRMHTSGEHQNYTSRLYVLKWTWLKTNGEFVVGDNPLCRWDTQNNAFNHGLSRRNLEITIPLTRKVTLWMHRNYNHADMAVCNASRTRELNRRQVRSAIRYVYGPSVEVLQR